MATINKSQINLLPAALRETGRIRALKKFLRTTSAVLLGIYLIAALLVFAAYIFLLRQGGSLLTRNSELVARVESFKAVETGLALLHDRLRLAQSVFASSAASPQELIEEVFSLLPPSVQVSEIKIGEEGIITLSAFSPTSVDLSELFKRLEDSRYKTIILKNLSLTSVSGYTFSLEVH